jgi:hypothetical protein
MVMGLGALSLAFSAAACSERVEAGDAEQAVADEPLSRVINVQVQEVAPGAFSEQFALTGTVQAARDVTVSAEEGGVVR